MNEELPHGWTREPLGKLAQIVSGGTPSRAIPAFWHGGTIPWVTPSDITRTRGRFLDEAAELITPLGLQSSSAKLVPPGTLLMTSRATLGEIRIATIEVSTNQGFKSLIPKKDVNGGFLFYAMAQNKERYKVFGIGSTFLEVSKHDTERFELLVAPLKQQRRIAEILGTVDEAIEQTEGLIAKQQQVKAGLMHDLFTRGVTDAGTLRPPHGETPHLYKESPVGWIPKEWDYRLLDDVAHRASGHTPNRNHPEYWDGGIKWVSLADSWRLDRVYISETDKEISALGIANSSAVLHPPGIVVLSRDAGIGKSAITTCEMAVSQHFMCWRCGPKLDTHYLYYWLQHRKREFENIATGTTIPTIGLRFFKNYRLPVSINVNEQKKIGAMLLSADQTIQAEAAHLAKLRQLKQGLMQDLLTSRVPVPT